MDAGQIGLVFLSILVACVLATPIYIAYLYFIRDPQVRKSGLGAPERALIPGLCASLVAPIGLFLFAWTGFNAPKIHWIVPTIGVVIYVAALLILMQCLFLYIPLSYPKYAASLFAGNGFFRSCVAASAIHFAYPLFQNLGVGRGVSVLGGLTVGGAIGVFGLYQYGASLRARSKFAV